MARACGPPCSTTADPHVKRFKRKGSGLVASFDAMEVTVLTQVIGEVFELVGPAEPRDDGQQWARDLGLTGVGDRAPEETKEPDPVTARLFPAAYREDDEAAQDFRRFTESELRAGKAAHAQRMLASLPAGGGKAVLDDDDCAAWLGALNDARLALGTALEVTADFNYELAALQASDPRAQRLFVYLWLGELQSLLLVAVMNDDIDH